MYKMTPFESNIISIYGETGKAWLEQLPSLVAQLSYKLGLRDLKTVENLSYNYVLAGFQANTPVILKVGLDADALKREAVALKCFGKHGAVNVIAADDGLLLLERAVPGICLKSYFPDKEMEAVAIACRVMNKLHEAKIPDNHPFPHIKDWLSVLDQDWDLPSDYLQKARKLRDQLLKTAGSDVLLHGDLHHDNILQRGEDWVVIDPKGVMGEPAYEWAAFIRNPIPELLNHQDAPTLIQRRITHFANILEVPAQRILDWCFVQAILSWVWAIEDGCETRDFQKLARVFFSALVLEDGISCHDL